MATMELKTWPVASTPIFSSAASAPAVWITLASVNTLEIDWMENGAVHVPFLHHLAVHGDEGDAEEPGIDLGERGDVVRVLALVEGQVLRVGGVDCRLCRALRIRSPAGSEKNDDEKRGGAEREHGCLPWVQRRYDQPMVSCAM